MSEHRRVVITGLGMISALGNDVETNWSRILRGENGVGPITRFDPKDHTVKFAASVQLDPLKHFTVPDQRKLDLFTMWALVATDEAPAELPAPPALPTSVTINGTRSVDS